MLGTPIKNDSEKPRYDLIPAVALDEVVAVLTYGAGKYSPHNWRKGFEWGRLLGASLRHIFAWARGEDLDPETKLSHLAHAVTNLMFLIESQKLGYGIDDRPE